MDLVQLEARIGTSLESFAVAGLALRDIRDGELWRAGHDTFGQYCVHKWALPKEEAEWLIAAGTCMDTLYQAQGPGKPLPRVVNQIVPLLDLEAPEAQVEAWREAVANTHGGKPSPELIAMAVETRSEPPYDDEDEYGAEVRDLFLTHLNLVSDDKYRTIKGLAKHLKETQGGVWLFIGMCEISPAALVYVREKRGETYYKIEKTGCILGRDRVMQLAQFIAESTNPVAAKAAAARIITLLGGG